MIFNIFLKKINLWLKWEDFGMSKKKSDLFVYLKISYRKDGERLFVPPKPPPQNYLKASWALDQS